MKVKHICIILILFVATGCNGQITETTKGIGTMSISPDDQTIAFSYFSNNISQIYKTDLTGRKIEKLISSENEDSYVFPKFSPDGKKIAFICFKNDNSTSNVYLTDMNGQGKHQITFQDNVINEVIFSSDGNTIYYTKSNKYESYSPLGRKAPHGFDIYYMKLDDFEEKKLTDWDAYSLSNITLVEDDKYILLRLADDLGVGLFLFPVNDPKKIVPFVPKNNPRKRADLYYDPAFSRNYNKVAITAPYELYLMDLKNKEAELLYDQRESNKISHLYNVEFFNTKEQILFRKINETNSFQIINFDGQGLKNIMLNVP